MEFLRLRRKIQRGKPIVRASLQRGLACLLTCAIAFFLTSNLHAQSQFTLGLNVNDAKYDTVYLDEPILFTVTLSNQFAEYDARNNREAQIYLDDLKSKLSKGEIKQEYYDKEAARVRATMKEPKEITVGTKSQPWAGMVSFELTKLGGAKEVMPLSAFPYPEAEAVAVLNKSSYHQAAYGFDNKLAAGDYQIMVKLQGGQSNQVELTVQSQKIPGDVMNSEAMLMHFADYYSLRGDNAKAMDYASKMITLFPNSSKGFVIRGDINERLQKWNEALADYETALRLFNEQFPDSYEQPEYLLEMIEHVKGKGGR